MSKVIQIDVKLIDERIKLLTKQLKEEEKPLFQAWLEARISELRFVRRGLK